MKTRKKSTNTYKFQSFAQRVSNINVDVLTQSGSKFHAIPDDEKDSFFRETLQDLSETNCSLDFIALYRELRPLVGSFNLVVYHKDQIAASLRQYLSLEGSYAIKACLKLFSSLARDLQHDFFDIFLQMFDVLVSLLKQRDAEVHEDTFVCLAFVLKCTWRSLVQHISTLFSEFKNLLVDSQAHVQLFAAELFAFLISKSKQKKSVIGKLFDEASAEPKVAQGVGCVVFQTLKGIKYQFVLSARDILEHCLSMFSTNNPELVYTILETTWSHSLKHTTPEHSELLFQVLYENIEKNDSSKDTGCWIRYTLRLLSYSVSHKHGYLIPDQTKLFQVMKTLFDSTDLDSDGIAALVELLRSSVETSRLNVDDELLVDVLSSFLHCTGLDTKQKLDTCQLLFKWRRFDEIFRKHILNFVSGCLLQQDSTHRETLKVLLNFIMDLVYKDVVLEQAFCVHSVEMTRVVFPTESDKVDHIQENLIKATDVSLWESDLQLLWSLVNCFCYCKFNDNAVSVTVLADIIRHGFKLCDNGCATELLCTFAHCVKSLLILENDIEKVVQVLSVEDMIQLISLHSANENCLQAFEAFCTSFGKQRNNFFPSDSFDSIYKILKDNLSSPRKLTCSLTLRIFKYFDSKEESSNNEDNDNDTVFDDVFQYCLDSLDIEVYISTYQERLTITRKLVWNEAMPVLHCDVALRFLVGNLFVNFSLMWEPISDLIASHAQGGGQKFWNLWLEFLDKAATNCCLPQNDKTVDGTGSHYSGAFSLCLDSICNNGRMDYKNFRILLWKAMVKFPQLAERNAKDVVHSYRRFMEEEYAFIDELMAQKQDLSIKSPSDHKQHERKSTKKGKVEFQALCAHLKVLSTFKKPKKIEEEFQLQKQYFDFLTSKDSEIQCLAISCLMTYAHPYMTPYKDNFDNLMIDSKFRDEMMNFTIIDNSEGEDSVVDPEHLKLLMPILIRLLYGKLQRRSGMGISGKTGATARQNIIMQFLINCSNDEVKPFFDIILEPFQALSGISLSSSAIDVKCVVPLRRLTGFLKMFSNLLKKLSGKVEHYLPFMFDALLKVLWTCAEVLKTKDEVHSSYISRIKDIRRMGLVLLNQLFEHELSIPFNDLTRDIFAVAVWPQLSNIVADSVQCATPLLKMFVTWSKNQKYHSLLTFSDGEDRCPLSCVYELLQQKSLSNTIEGFLMTVTLNLLTTETATDSVELESSGIEILKPYITQVLKHISDKLLLKMNKSTTTRKKQMMKNVLPSIQFSVLSELSKLVSDSEQATLLVGILFPLLRCIGAETTQLHIVNTINNMLTLVQDSSLYIDMVPSLFSLVEARAPRQVLCQVYVKMTKDNEELRLVGELAKSLNSWDSKLLDEPDYNCRLAAFRSVNEHVNSSQWGAKQILPLVHIAIHTLITTGDLSLRNASSNCIEVIIELVKSRQVELFSVLILRTIYPAVKSALKSKRDDVRAEFISLLGDLIKTFQDNTFADMSCLCSDDLETDFFKNFNHIQVHRKIRAIRLLSTCCEEGKITVTNMFSVFMPMITPFMFGKNTANKEHNLLSEAIAAVGCIMKRLPWSKYVHVLKNYLKVLQKDLKNQKNILRLLMVVLDNFHFDLSSLGEKGIDDVRVLVDPTKKARLGEAVSEEETKDEKKEKKLDDGHVDEKLDDQDEEGKEAGEDKDEEEESKDDAVENLDEKTEESEHDESENEEDGEDEVERSDNSAIPPDPSARIYYVLTQTIIPQLNKFLKKKGAYDSAKSNYKEVDDEDLLKLPMEFALSQLLLKLPQAVLNVNLPGVLLRVSQSLKSHSREVRDSSRDILKKISNSLGASYLPLVLKEMKSLLQQGYQRHILGFTLHAILENMVSNFKSGDVDGVVSDTMEIVLDELIGTVAEEKDVSAITGKLHEAQHCKSNATSEILAKFISNEVIGKVMDPIKQALDTTQNHTTIHKVEELLFHVANGLQNNESLIDTDVLVFVHCVVSDAMSQTSPQSQQEPSTTIASSKIDSCPDSFLVPAQPTRGGVVPDTCKKTNNHILVNFGLHLLSSCLKRQRFVDANPNHLAMLDPIIPLIVANLSSPYNRVITLSLKCLCYLLKFQLPSTKTNYGVLGKNIFKIMKTFTQAGAVRGNEVELIANSFKSMTILVRDHKEFVITEKQLKILLTLVEEDIHSSSRQVVALPLLKSILSRKVKVNLLTDIIVKVSNLSIQDQDASVQLNCRKIVLNYLLDYPLGKKIVNHFDFYIAHLSYEEEPGRVSALEMLTLIISNIPERLLVEYAGYMFMPLVMMLVNDDSALCRKLCGSTVKTLLEKLPVNTRDELFTMVTKFYSNGNVALHHVAVQLIGFFAEVERKSFQRRMDTALPMFKETLEKYSSVDDNTEEDTAAEKSLYITLNCLVKVFATEELFGSKDEYTNILETLSDLAKPHLLHSHAWIRLASSQLMSLYFGLFTPQSWVEKLKGLFDDEKRSKDVMNANVKDLCFFFLSQLKDENLTKEIGNQAIKNLIFLFRVVSILDPAITDCATDDIDPNQETNTVTSDKKTLTVRSFIRKVSHIAAHESANNPKESKKRICVLRFIAAVSLFLGEARLKDYLLDILPAIHREISTRTDATDSLLYTLAQEVLDLVQGVVPKDTFADVYGQLQKSKLEKKEAKKRKLVTEAITNPMQVALQKQKRNLTKRDQRKRKLDEKKPERKLKKKRTADVT